MCIFSPALISMSCFFDKDRAVFIQTTAFGGLHRSVMKLQLARGGYAVFFSWMEWKVEGSQKNLSFQVFQIILRFSSAFLTHIISALDLHTHILSSQKIRYW